jgi:hypothetical protein
VLRYLGCNAFAVEEGRWSAGNDIGLRASFLWHDIGRPSGLVRAALADLGRGAPWGQQVRRVATLLSDPSASRAHALAQCDAALHCGRKLAMPPGVLAALAASDERFDGSGLPDGVAGVALPVALRYVEVAKVAKVAEVVRSRAGVQAAAAEVSRRAGHQLDPAIAAQLAADASVCMQGFDQPSVWDEYLAAEPGAWCVGTEQLTPLFEAFVSIADLKSGWFAGHSQAVAALVAEGMSSNCAALERLKAAFALQPAAQAASRSRARSARA